MYTVLAYYKFIDIEDPNGLIEAHKERLGALDARGRIYISEEGINGQASILTSQKQAYIDWMHTLPPFQGLEFKEHAHSEHAFAKLTVKYRSQLAALDAKVNWKDQGQHLSPEKWREMLEKRDQNTLLIDVRNKYESDVGHFEGAVCPDLDQFREFPAYADALKEQCDPKKTRVMMYCTGGIRCELYSALMKEKGFEEVYQLDGGVIKYGLEEGKKHWKGNLFVFDDRMVVPLEGNDAPPIATCHTCDAPSDTYHNCANMDCNALFLSCEACNTVHKGCCSPACEEAPRLRPPQEGMRPKPFRKLRSMDSASQ